MKPGKPASAQNFVKVDEERQTKREVFAAVFYALRLWKDSINIETPSESIAAFAVGDADALLAELEKPK